MPQNIKINVSKLSVKVVAANTKARPDGNKLSIPYSELLGELQGSASAIRAEANANDRVVLLLEVCLQRGLHSEKDLIRALWHIGENPKHVAKLLKINVGSHWARSPKGIYYLFD